MVDTPALQYLLEDEVFGRDVDGTPSECCYCPFGHALDEPYPPNPYDQGEGYYRCDLLNLGSVWGESPKCQIGDWRKRAREELRQVMTPR